MSASKNHNGAVSIALGTVIGVLSIALAGWGSFWDTLGIAQDQKDSVVTALAILFVNLGFLLGVYFQQQDFKADMLATQRNELRLLQNLIPSIQIFTTYTGEAAMSTLAYLIPTARVALNTRILALKTGETQHALGSPWDNAVKDSVKNGLTFREVLSPDCENIAQERISATFNGKGRYQAAILRHRLPSFLNFIVLECDDGHKEVWFGWIVSLTAGWEGTVVRTSEQKIVSLFERWHLELFTAAQSVS